MPVLTVGVAGAAAGAGNPRGCHAAAVAGDAGKFVWDAGRWDFAFEMVGADMM